MVNKIVFKSVRQIMVAFIEEAKNTTKKVMNRNEPKAKDLKITVAALNITIQSYLTFRWFKWLTRPA